MFNPKVKFVDGHPQPVDYTPNAAVSSGDVVVLNGVLYFAIYDIAAGVLGSLNFSGGLWDGNKANGVSFANGDAVYYNPTGNPLVGTAGTGCFTSSSSGAIFAGYSVGAAANGDQTVRFIKVNAGGGSVAGIASGYKLARGQATTVTAADTIATGLTTVIAVVASLDSDPVDNPEWVSATVGDQAGSPVAGSFILKTWQNTAGNDPTPTAATTFGKKVNWIAIGT